MWTKLFCENQVVTQLLLLQLGMGNWAFQNFGSSKSNSKIDLNLELLFLCMVATKVDCYENT